MATRALQDTLHRITEPVVTSLGLTIWGIEVLQAGKPVVRIYVDVPATPAATEACTVETVDTDEAQVAPEQNLAALSATVDQCAHISRLVGLAMEVEEVFPSAYVLEVSSPGFSRPFFSLEQMVPYIGDEVSIVLTDFLPSSPLPGRKKFSGILLAVTNDDCTLRIETGTATHDMCIPWENVRKAARVHVFITPEKPGKKRKEAK